MRSDGPKIFATNQLKISQNATVWHFEQKFVKIAKIPGTKQKMAEGNFWPLGWASQVSPQSANFLDPLSNDHSLVGGHLLEPLSSDWTWGSDQSLDMGGYYWGP